MSKKPSGLAAFTTRKPAVATDPAAGGSPVARAPAEGKRGRGQGETVALTVRVSRSDWQKLHQLALSEGISLQTLAIRGFNREMASHGLPELVT